MEKICGIYKITSPTNKIYIGQSRNIYERWGNYRRQKCFGQKKLFASLKKYGWEKHKSEIIHKCTVEQLNDLEKYYVDLFECFNSENGLNLKDGGIGHGGHSEETKFKMSMDRMGQKPKHIITDKMREIFSKTHKGKVLSEETKNKIRLAHLGKKITEEQRLVKSIAMKKAYVDGKIKKRDMKGEKNTFFNKKHSTYSKKKMSLTRKNNGCCLKEKNGKSKLTLNNSTGIFYECMIDAAESIPLNINKFYKQLNGWNKNKTDFILV